MEKEKIRELIVGHKERFLSRRGLVRRDEEGREKVDHGDIEIAPLWKWLLE